VSRAKSSNVESDVGDDIEGDIKPDVRIDVRDDGIERDGRTNQNKFLNSAKYAGTVDRTGQPTQK
jgi:hypothetical protein